MALSTVAGNHRQGILAINSVLSVERAAVVETAPDHQGVHGRGISIESGSDATVESTLVARNHRAGVMVWDSTLDMRRSAVVETKLGEIEDAGFGVEAYGGIVSVASSLVASSRDLGIRANAAPPAMIPSAVSIAQTVVRDTAPNSTGLGGQGLSQKESSEVAFMGSVLADSTEASAVCFGDATSLIVGFSKITGTRETENPVAQEAFADGLVAGFGKSHMEVRSSLIDGNARAGAFYDGSSGVFEGNVVTGSKWALVLQEAAVSWKGSDNDLACNKHSGMSNPGLTPPPPPDVSLGPEDLLE
jgi:hypothetical protein